MESQKPVRRPGVPGWFDVRNRKLGSWAFALNRLTGLGLVFYLVIHFFALSLLIRGEAYYDEFVAFAHNPLVLVMDLALIFGMIFHGLNGIRVALVGMGIGVRHHKLQFWLLMAVGAIVLAVSAFKILIG